MPTATRSGRPTPLLPDAPTPGALRLLLALADPAFAAAVERHCRPHDVVVTASVRGAAPAVYAAAAAQPDVCLIDRDMSEWARAASELRARVPRTKIVLIGNGSSDDVLLEAIRTGIEGYLFKDMNLERLPLALLDVSAGKAALPRNVAARVLAAMRQSGPSWRSVPASGPRGRLTQREWEVLELLAQELTTYEVAERLVLTAGAVRSHISSAVRKLGAANRLEAVRLVGRDAA
ncbi:MAG: LuxR C-terminal-related transcriptional regulator [Gaiellaceae bacterium]